MLGQCFCFCVANLQPLDPGLPVDAVDLVDLVLWPAIERLHAAKVAVTSSREAAMLDSEADDQLDKVQLRPAAMVAAEVEEVGAEAEAGAVEVEVEATVSVEHPAVEASASKVTTAPFDELDADFATLQALLDRPSDVDGGGHQLQLQTGQSFVLGSSAFAATQLFCCCLGYRWRRRRWSW